MKFSTEECWIFKFETVVIEHEFPYYLPLKLSLLFIMLQLIKSKINLIWLYLIYFSRYRQKLSQQWKISVIYTTAFYFSAVSTPSSWSRLFLEYANAKYELFIVCFRKISKKVKYAEKSVTESYFLPNLFFLDVKL